MRNFTTRLWVALTAAVLGCICHACQEVDVVIPEKNNLDINQQYYSTKGQMESAAQEHLDVPLSRDGDFYLSEYLINQSVEYVDSVKDSMEERIDCTYSEYEDLVTDEFLSCYSAEDYLQLKHTLEKYLEAGGHSVNLITEYQSGMNAEIAKMFVHACAVADFLGSKDFWVSEGPEEMFTRVTLVGLTPEAHERACRRIYRDELCVRALQSGAAILLGIGTDTLPALCVLDEVANFLGAFDSSLRYYRCMHSN